MFKKHTTSQEQTPLERIYEVAGCTTQSELARVFGFNVSYIRNLKNSNTVPAGWLLKILRLKHIHPDWILTGTEPKYLLPVYDINRANIVYKVKPPQECSAQELLTELMRRTLLELKYNSE